MDYLVTWYEGDEVCYRFVDDEALSNLLENDRGYIVVPLQ